jgi:hypothetical protein
MSIENGKLPLATAKQYVKNWINRKQISTDQLRAFTVRRTELEFLLMQMDITSSDAARFYLGDKAVTPDAAPDLSLIMAGVQGFVPGIFLNPPFVRPNFITNLEMPNLPGKEKYFTYFPEHSIGSSARHHEIEEPVPGEYVFDFAYPCPHTCALDSELMPPPLP